ncbi:hypothetical protein H5410_055437 [Solanum commersonii]|uniref:Ulp1 protease family, C-terminal catalytic domain containing protein n=1 Tax=Solanum commersonii TaxID=4109 RepID=A0A9J5WJ36_SOLCO|nr:hypothetical protein H5410_055437 [Solanum commersonii]
MDHDPSFSIGITQLNSSNTDRIYNSDDDKSVFAKFLSDKIHITSDGFRYDYLHSRYAALLWRYSCDKAKVGYVSENDDPLKPKRQFTPPPQDDLVHIE